MQWPLVEGRDYYLEDGKMVFTATFLQQRGYCCANGCRHCPYGYRNLNTPSAPAPRSTPPRTSPGDASP
ncbi:MAG: DUF5522 domain-containing protein [Gemmataceae bacterium]